MGDANLSGAELYALKTKAMEFYAQNGVPEKMEDVLNTMFFDQPTDVYGHLVSLTKSYFINDFCDEIYMTFYMKS